MSLESDVVAAVVALIDGLSIGVVTPGFVPTEQHAESDVDGKERWTAYGVEEVVSLLDYGQTQSALLIEVQGVSRGRTRADMTGGLDAITAGLRADKTLSGILDDLEITSEQVFIESVQDEPHELMVGRMLFNAERVV